MNGNYIQDIYVCEDTGTYLFTENAVKMHRRKYGPTTLSKPRPHPLIPEDNGTRTLFTCKVTGGQFSTREAVEEFMKTLKGNQGYYEAKVNA
jgi:hypothetical protein